MNSILSHPRDITIYVGMLIWIYGTPLDMFKVISEGEVYISTYELVAISMYMKHIHLHFILYERHTYNH